MPNLYYINISLSSNTPQQKKTPYGVFFNGGQGWIRTTVVVRRQIYSLLPLATRAPTLIINYLHSQKESAFDGI